MKNFYKNEKIKCIYFLIYLINEIILVILVYLKSIRPYFLNDDDFNWNFGVASAAAGEYKDAEEGLL